MGGNPRDEGLGNISGLLEAMIYSDPRLPASHRLGGMQIQGGDIPTTESLNALTNQYFNVAGQNINRNVAGAGQLGAARGYSMGLSNPFAFAQHAENQARGAMGGLEADRARQMMQNPLTAFQADAQSRQYNNNLLMQLLGMKVGVVGQREGNVAQDVLGGTISGLGTLGGALIGGPVGAMAGSQLGSGFQTDSVDMRQYT